MREISFSVNSKIELISIVEDGVEFFIKNICKIDEDSAFWFMVGFHEVVINAYLHGNKKRPELLVDIAICFSNGELKARVTDRGKGFNIKDIPDPTKPENIFKPSGRGLLFAKKSCDSVIFSKCEDKFTVEIIKKIKEVQNA